MDEAGSENIYKINLLEAMLMVEDAWDSIDQVTIKHCWEHTRIQPEPRLATLIPNPAPAVNPSTSSPHATQVALTDTKAWDIMCEFAVGDMTMPKAEEQLRAYLSGHYVFAEWKSAFDVVLGAETNELKALDGLISLQMRQSHNLSQLLTSITPISLKLASNLPIS